MVILRRRLRAYISSQECYGGGYRAPASERLNAIFVTGRQEFLYMNNIIHIYIYLFADLVSKRYEWRQIARVVKRNYSLVGSAAAAIAGEKYNI